MSAPRGKLNGPIRRGAGCLCMVTLALTLANPSAFGQPSDASDLVAVGGGQLLWFIDDLDRQTHTLRIVSTPLVRALIRVRNQELVNEVAFRTHYLDTVVTRIAR